MDAHGVRLSSHVYFIWAMYYDSTMHYDDAPGRTWLHAA